MAMEIKKCRSIFIIFFSNIIGEILRKIKDTMWKPMHSHHVKVHVFILSYEIIYLIEPSYIWCKCRAEEAHVKSSNPSLNWIFIKTNSHLVHYIELEIYELTRCKVPQFFSARNFGPLVKNLYTNNTNWENHLIWTQQPMTCQNLRRKLLKTLRQFNDSCT